MRTLAPRIAVLALSVCIAGRASAEEFSVEVTDSSFTPTELRIRPGDTVVWRNTGGLHNVVADDLGFRSGAPSSARFTFRHTFERDGTYPYFCEAHGGAGGIGMAGRVIVGTPAFVIDHRVQGTWFDPRASAQGVFVDVAPSISLVGLAWFTWGDEGSYDWLTGAGTYRDDSVTIVLQRSRGGVRNTAAPTQTRQAGTATLRFTDCAHATLDYALTDPLVRGSMILQRLLPSTTCAGAGTAAPAR